jgi:endoglucanase
MTNVSHGAPLKNFRDSRLGFIALAFVALTPCCTSDAVFPHEELSSTRAAVTATSTVIVNQLGYLTRQKKVAVGVGSCSAVAFQVKSSSGTTVFSGTTSANVTDPGSGDSVCKADFSAFITAGTGYTVTIGSLGTSDPFAIQTTDRYTNLYVDAMKYFKYHRLGTEVGNISLTGSKGGTVSRTWSLRPTTALTAYSSWTTGTFNIDGGHADAGDFGLYPDNTVQAMWTLMNLKELRNPDNAVYDLIGEIDYGVKYLMGVLPADATKQAAHKCHDDSWSTQNWGGYPTGNDVSATVRHCMGPSITATYSVARALGQAARIVTNATTATNYWNKAVAAWTRANGATTPVYAGPSPGAAVGGGDYQDNTASDDKFDAAVELYLTAKKRGVAYTSYLSAVTSSPHYKQISRGYDWGESGESTQGNLSLWTYNKKIGSLGTEIDSAGIQTAIVAEADAILASIAANGYPTPIAGTNYVWGSNKIVVDSIVILGHAREATGDVKYTKGIHQAMDYLMGVNTLRLSFITGYGTYFEKATHDRQANGNSPIGWLAGGPLLSSLVNDSLTPKTANPAKNYYVSDTGWDNAWCSKENTIDWNAPLVWAAWFVRSSVADVTTAACTVAADCNDNNPCTTDACTASVCSNTAVANGTTCNDNNAGTCGDVCTAGLCAGIVAPATPAAPAVAAGNAQVAASWSAVSGAANYTLKRTSGSPTGTYANVATGLTTTSYTNTGLTNGTTYYYKLSAANSCGLASADSAASVGVIPTASCTPPAIPTGLAAIAGNAQVSLSWSAVSGATSYNVLRSTTSGSGYTPVASNVTTTSYVNTGLTNGTTYYYVVQSVGACTSANSSQVSAAPTAEPCIPAATFGAGVINSGNFNTTGPYCFRTSYAIAGWGCSNFDGRTLLVNDVAKSCGNMPLPTMYNGYYYFEASAGTYSYASIYWW